MERTLGTLPRDAARGDVQRAEKNFRHGYLRWPERAMDRESEEHVQAQRRLRDCWRSTSAASRWRRRSPSSTT